MGDMQHQEVILHNSVSPKSSFNIDEPPMVFQCAQCNVIVGDSTAWVCIDDISRTITLNNVTSAVVEEEMKTASTGFDAGSTYYKMACATCKEEIGRKYKGAVNHLDSARGKYTLFVDKLSSYQIGSFDKERSETTDMSDILSMANIRDIHVQLSKLTAVMQGMNDRVLALEQGYQTPIGDDNMSVKSMSYPCSSYSSVPPRFHSPSYQPNRIFPSGQLPVTQICNGEGHGHSLKSDGSVFKRPQVRHPRQHTGHHDNYPESVQSTYSHLEQLHKVDQQERPLGIDPDDSFQSHSNYVRNIHSSKTRQQRRNSLSLETAQHKENVPQNFRREELTQGYRGQRNFSSGRLNEDNRNKVDEESNKGSCSTSRGNLKRKEVPSCDPLQAMMSRRHKRRI
ncbi:uncharacterized protein LOC133185894 isoform X2 [Saccostrea echinata]|uniref:uncharacterized protein LOC133185894 isoform X2 n=1 Tax=Saccostrea echinata TaxID=191078 RepID=UPI002A7F4076|nr:uncharacterized protein LOC133185894 isoform X2 [Saccostrea echinata]